MSEAANISRHELIRLIGNVLTDIDVLSAHFDPGTTNRLQLNDLRNQLDLAQRKLVRSALNENTQTFNDLTDNLKKINDDLSTTINDVNKVATNLETLVRFVGAVQKIAELAP